MARKAKLGLPLQTLRNAPDAMEGRRLRSGVMEIDPDQIEVAARFEDRLALEVDDLVASIAAHGQRVPVLVRPLEAGRYGLIYGRRRLEACRTLGLPVRAIVTEMDGTQALRDQLLENQGRRDLSFIERALVAAALLEGDHLPEGGRTNRAVAEVLNLTEAAVSQMLGVVRVVGVALISAIGAAPAIGRPRWEELKLLVASTDATPDDLIAAARGVDDVMDDGDSLSERRFMAVLGFAKEAPAPRMPDHARIALPGIGSFQLRQGRKADALKLDLALADPDFARWLNRSGTDWLAELHSRWQSDKT